MSDKRNAYHVLGLKKGASEQEIKEAYKVLARRHHPDKNQGDPSAMARFIEIKEAYEELIEKKTSSSEILVKMEEKGHELRRRGVFKRLALSVLAAAALAGGGYAAWELHLKDLGFKTGIRAALAGDVPGARAKLEPIIAAGGPQALEARDALVWALVRDGRNRQKNRQTLDDAIAVERQALELLETARDARGLALKGDLLFRLGDVPGALKAWRDARAAEDADAETYARALAGSLRAHAFSEAAAVGKELDARFAGSPWSRWGRSLLRLRAGDADAAVEPGRGDPAAVRMAYAVGQIAHARTTAETNERSHRLEEAESIVKGLLDDVAKQHRRPDQVEFAFGFPWLQTPIRNENSYDWMPSLGVEDSEQAVRLALVALVEVRNPDGALALAQDAFQIDRRATHAELAVADLILRSRDMGGIERARKLFEHVAEDASAWKPNRARAAAGVARTYAVVARGSGSKHLHQERAERIAAWRRARALDPSNPEFALGLALALASQGQHAERASVDRETIKDHPGYGLARLDLGLALLALKRERDAIAELERAARLPDAQALALLNLGHVHYDRGRRAQALAAYEKVTRLGDAESRATAWFRIACLHSLARDREAAKRAWQSAQAELGVLGDDDGSRATPLSPVRIDIGDPALDWVRPHLAKAGPTR